MSTIIKLGLAALFLFWFVTKVSSIISFFWSLVIGLMILMAARSLIMTLFKPKSSLNDAARAEIEEVMKRHGVK